MRDIWIVCKKDLKELLAARGGRWGFLLRIAILVGMFGLFPLSQKELWTGGVMPLAYFLMVPLFFASGAAADSFAGERERKTLETLLATRLPDWAILLGKVLAALIYAWLFTVLCMMASLIGLNLVKETRGLYLYPPLVFLAGLLGSTLTGLLIVGLGVLVSLRARSVREAQQMLVIPMWLLFMAVGFGLPTLLRVLPQDARQDIVRRLAAVDPVFVGVSLVLALIVVDVAVLIFGMRRFRRARLILA